MSGITVKFSHKSILGLQNWFDVYRNNWKWSSFHENRWKLRWAQKVRSVLLTVVMCESQTSWRERASSRRHASNADNGFLYQPASKRRPRQVLSAPSQLFLSTEFQSKSNYVLYFMKHKSDYPVTMYRPTCKFKVKGSQSINEAVRRGGE